MLGAFQSRQAHSSRPQPRSRARRASSRSSALPAPLPLASGRTNKSSRYIPARPRKVEKQGETHWPAVLLRQQDFRSALVENPFLQQFRRGDNLFAHALVCGKLPDVSIHSRPIRRLTPQPTERGRADCPSLKGGGTKKDFIGFAVVSTPLFPLKGEASNHKGTFDEAQDHGHVGPHCAANDDIRHMFSPFCGSGRVSLSVNGGAAAA